MSKCFFRRRLRSAAGKNFGNMKWKNVKIESCRFYDGTAKSFNRYDSSPLKIYQMSQFPPTKKAPPQEYINFAAPRRSILKFPCSPPQIGWGGGANSGSPRRVMVPPR